MLVSIARHSRLSWKELPTSVIALIPRVAQLPDSIVEMKVQLEVQPRAFSEDGCLDQFNVGSYLIQ